MALVLVQEMLGDHMRFIKTAGIIVLIFVVIVILLSIVILALTHNCHTPTVKTGGLV